MQKKSYCKVCKSEIPKGAKCKSCKVESRSGKPKVILEQTSFEFQKTKDAFDPQPGG